MPEPIDTFPMQPLDPIGEPMQQHLAEEAARTASRSGGSTLGNLVNGADIVGDVVEAAADSADVAGAIFETVGSAAEVSGHVLSGAFEALGSVGDLAGCLDGCSGCSAVIVFVIGLATAGVAVAGSLF